MGTSKRYSEEVRERAVRMVAEHLHEYSSQWATITSIAAKIGCTAESLRRWVHGSERDSGIPLFAMTEIYEAEARQGPLRVETGIVSNGSP
jgi:transposase-like protein